MPAWTGQNLGETPDIWEEDMTTPKKTISRRSLLRTGAATGLAALMAPGLVGRARAQGQGHLRVIHASPATLVLWSVTYLAEDMGFYADEGLTIERLPLNGGPVAMTALVAGEGDLQLATPGEALSAVSRGQDIRILESYTATDAYSLCVGKAFAEAQGVTADSPLEARTAAAAALSGAKLGITAPGSATDLITRMALKQVGLNPDTDAELVPMGSIVNVVSGLSNGAVDGGALLAPFTEQTAHEFGVVPLLGVATGEIPEAARLQGQALHARGQDIDARAEDFAAFVRADLRALKMILDDPDAARDKLRATRFAQIDEAVWPAVWAGQLATFRTPRVTEDGLRAWLETGSIGGNPDPATFPYEPMIHMAFVDQGLAKLGLTF